MELQEVMERSARSATGSRLKATDRFVALNSLQMVRSFRIIPLRRAGLIAQSLLTLLFILFAVNCYSAVDGATLQNVRVGFHNDFTRLVFDIDGPRPLSIGPQEKTGVVIRFGRFQTSLRSEDLLPRLPSFLSGISFRQGDSGSMIYIAFQKPDISVKPSILSKSKSSHRVVLDFYPAAVPAAPPKVDKAITRNPEEKEKPKQNPPQPSEAAAPAFVPLTDAAGAPSAATPEASSPYDEADSFFLAHENDLAQHAQQILELYRIAMKAAPSSSKLPVALYRYGVACLAAGNAKKAEESFKKVINDYPAHPLVGLCWLGTGKAQQHKKADVEAVLAFRSALTFPLEKAKEAEAHCFMGKSLTRIGSHKDALEALGKCLNDDPASYIKEPNVLRSIGESSFALQQYDKSCDYLIRYINLDAAVPDRDIILAKIAETLLYMNEHDLAKKLYTHIERHYPDSEGYIIGAIRRAELMERQNERGKRNAVALYQELSEKLTSSPLSELVIFKLASWESEQGNHKKSLSLIDDFLLNKDQKSPPGKDILTLRDKVAEKFLRRSFEEKNYNQVIELYKANQPLFKVSTSPDIILMAAESYEALKHYPIGVDLYEQLLSGSPANKDGLLLKLARSQFLMGDLGKAAEKAAQIRSESLEAEKSELLGQIYFNQKKYDEAARQLAKSFQRDPNFERIDFQLAFAYAESLLELNKSAEALQFLQKVSGRVGTEEVDKKVRAGLLESRCYQSLKQAEKAIGVLEELAPIITADQVKDQLNYQLSQLYLESGQSDKAVESLNKLMASSQPLWKAAAEQQLNYMQLQKSEKK